MMTNHNGEIFPLRSSLISQIQNVLEFQLRFLIKFSLSEHEYLFCINVKKKGIVAAGEHVLDLIFQMLHKHDFYEIIIYKKKKKKKKKKKDLLHYFRSL